MSLVKKTSNFTHNERCLSLKQIHSTRFETHFLSANTMFSPFLFSHCAPCWMITLSPLLKEFETFLNLNFIFSSFSIFTNGVRFKLTKWHEITSMKHHGFSSSKWMLSEID